jgi:hypothetical protein
VCRPRTGARDPIRHAPFRMYNASRQWHDLRSCVFLYFVATPQMCSSPFRMRRRLCTAPSFGGTAKVTWGRGCGDAWLAPPPRPPWSRR